MKAHCCLWTMVMVRISPNCRVRCAASTSRPTANPTRRRRRHAPAVLDSRIQPSRSTLSQAHLDSRQGFISLLMSLR
ncbi:hypothetical protein INR49_024372 [Caranx melampygus]|nr:hypothetical protein INR49_024372 [Caranx melampygus]